MKSILLGLALLLQVQGETLQVSPEGPLKTLAAARDKIRELRRSGAKGAMTVLVRKGTYYLDETFVLTPEDSGVTYAAYPGERAILSGGRVITGWNRKEGARMPTAPAAFDFNQLFVGGKRAVRVRAPHQGFYRVDGRLLQAKPATFKFHGDTIQKAWADKGDVEVTVLCQWQELRGRITAVDAVAHTVQLAAEASPNMAPKGRQGPSDCEYYVENTPQPPAFPYEWSLDRKAGVVSYMGEEMPEEAVAPVLEQLVRIEGVAEDGKRVHDIVFRGLDFRHSAWKLAEEGYRGVQSESEVRAAIEAEGAENITIDHCMFTQMGNYAVSFGRGCFRNRVTSNEFVDIGGGGVKIGEAGIEAMNRQRPNEADRNGGNIVADNHMHRLGVVYPASAGVLVGHSSDNTVSHNHIHDMTATPISVGWTWQYKLSSLKNNIIEYNHLHDIGHGPMSDMGGIYTLGEQPGTVLRNNLIHDITALAYGGWGIYLDQASTGIVVEKNVVYNCSHAGFNQHFGKENVVRNNVFAFNKEAQMTRVRADQPVSFTMERNIVYFDGGDLLGHSWKGGLQMDHNIYWDARGLEVRPAGLSWKEWQASGMDTNSVVADPMFVNADNFDFRLKPGSPALKMGFQQIDLTTVGTRGTAGPAGATVRP